MGLTFGPGRHGRNMMIRLSRGREKKSRPDCLLSLLKKCSKIDFSRCHEHHRQKKCQDPESISRISKEKVGGVQVTLECPRESVTGSGLSTNISGKSKVTSPRLPGLCCVWGTSPPQRGFTIPHGKACLQARMHLAFWESSTQQLTLCPIFLDHLSQKCCQGIGTGLFRKPKQIQCLCLGKLFFKPF